MCIFIFKTIIISKISSYSCNDHKKFPFLSIIDLLFKSFRGIILNSNSVCFQSIKGGLLVARSDQDLQGIILDSKIQDCQTGSMVYYTSKHCSQGFTRKKIRC